MSWTPPPSARAQKGQVPVPPIPANYLDAEDSGLVAEINASTTEVGPFDLTATKASKVKEKMRD